MTRKIHHLLLHRVLFSFFFLLPSMATPNKAENCIDLSNPRMTLNDGHSIPRVGLGVFRAQRGGETYNAVKHAIQAGYRHVDTAELYGNEADVGRAVRDSGIPREEIWITSKLWPDYSQEQIQKADENGLPLGYATARDKAKATLERLGLKYVDLYLIHSPASPNYRIGAWLALQDLQSTGKIRSIGVSNYGEHHLRELLEDERVKIAPSVNQVEIHPWMRRDALVAFCQAQGIQVEAYSPLAKATTLQDHTLVTVAKSAGKTPAQVLIRWSLQRGYITLPKSTNPERIEQNTAVYDFELNVAQMEQLNGLDRQMTTGWDPTTSP